MSAKILFHLFAILTVFYSESRADVDIEHKTCGIRPPMARAMDSLIVGGQEVTRNSWPWMALVGVGTGVCGGVVIKPRWIVTAAHCMNATKPSEYIVVVGGHNLKEAEADRKIVEVEKVYEHESYKDDDSINDIALLYLKEDIKFDKTVQPVCIGTELPAEGTLCYVTGYGLTETKNELDAFTLREVSLPIISNKVCSKWNRQRISDLNFCAAYPQGGKDSCRGDSGGPLVCASGRRWELQGIVNSGPANCGKAQTAGIYTKIPMYRTWIQDQMRLAESQA